MTWHSTAAELLALGLVRASSGALLALADDVTGATLVATPSDDGQRLVLGVVDEDGDYAAVALDQDVVAEAHRVFGEWLDRR